MLPADDPVQGLWADVQGGFDILVVQVEGGRGGVGAWGVQADGQVERRQTSNLLLTHRVRGELGFYSSVS